MNDEQLCKLLDGFLDNSRECEWLKWGFQYGVFDAVVHYVQDSALSKVVTGLGSHEKITNILTGTRSELVYPSQSEPKKQKNSHSKK